MARNAIIEWIKNWQTGLECLSEKLVEVDIERGIFQGDLLSLLAPLLILNLLREASLSLLRKGIAQDFNILVYSDRLLWVL